ncbi:MAG: hypothetical protein KA807_05555 [Prolixibacteraceae bacterium]|nr:hypothetical protein [Prolixibacteraceae bacterium]
MAKKTINVKVRVFIEEMLSYYQWDNSYGTIDKPFPAESFYLLEAPKAKFTGPLKDILVFENDTEFHWNIESGAGGIVNFVDLNGDSQLDLQMITSSPSQKKWDKTIKNAPQMDDKGKIKFLPKDKEHKDGSLKKEFVFATTDSVPEDAVMKYSILFEFKDQKDKLKYGFVDPFAGGGIPPPPPPP